MCAVENGEGSGTNSNNDDLNAQRCYPFENAVLAVEHAQAYCTLGYSVIRHPREREKRGGKGREIESPKDHILIRASFARYCDDSHIKAESDLRIIYIFQRGLQLKRAFTLAFSFNLVNDAPYCTFYVHLVPHSVENVAFSDSTNKLNNTFPSSFFTHSIVFSKHFLLKIDVILKVVTK